MKIGGIIVNVMRLYVVFRRLLIQLQKLYYRVKAYKVYRQIKQLKKEVKAMNRQQQQET